MTVQAQILDLILRLRDERGMSVLLVTHDLGVVAETADHVAVMYGGRIVERASCDELFADPRHPYAWGPARLDPALTGERPGVPADHRRHAAIADGPAGRVSVPRALPHEFEQCGELPPLNERSPGHLIAAGCRSRRRAFAAPAGRAHRPAARRGRDGRGC